ncbi:hypothetical protein BDZ45DRAFT_695894 [Acephala macrosclerotiorum]|nr:hypothetical protein BDZ45DRAFT_695894 [Acephala macrosclerotiorum]
MSTKRWPATVRPSFELRMPALQNTAVKTIDDIRLKRGAGMGSSSKKSVFEKAADGSLLRLYICHYVAHHASPSNYRLRRLGFSYPYGLLVEATEYQAVRVRDNIRTPFTGSNYYVSEE